MKTRSLIGWSFAALAAPWLLATEPTVPSNDKPPVEIRAVVDLIDGSRLMGTPVDKAIPLTMKYANPELPVELIMKCQVKHDPEALTLDLIGGDHLTGTTRLEAFAMDTLIGRVSPRFSQIDRMEITTRSTGALAVGEGDLDYCGFKWVTWRTRFEMDGKRLRSIPQAREGYNYGHSGNGRGAVVCTNIGNKDWTDYRMDVDYCMTGVVPELNPHGLPVGFRGGGIMFHMVSGAESWNEAPGTTGYQLGLGPDGTWSLDAIVDSYCKTAVGFGNHSEACHRNLAKGEGLQLDGEKGNHFRIEVIGKCITIWIDDHVLAKVTDEKMDEMVAGKNLSYGGVAIGWGFETMGWIENFTATRL